MASTGAISGDLSARSGSISRSACRLTTATRQAFKRTAAPLDRPIQLCGLDKALPFVAPVDAIDSEPGASTSGPRGGR
jgi:hypothetical protein